MVTVGGAKALQHETMLGTIEVGKKADLITINLMQPHLTPTHSLLNTIVDCASEHDVDVYKRQMILQTIPVAGTKETIRVIHITGTFIR